MIQANFSCTAYPGTSARPDILNLLDVRERAERFAWSVHPARAPEIPRVSFMGFWDLFRRKPREEEPAEDGKPKEKRRIWNVFRGGGSHGGGHFFPAGGGRHREIGTGGVRRGHYGGIGGVGHSHHHGGGGAGG